MRAAVVPIDAGRREGVYVVLDACPPGRPPAAAGVFLVDTGSGKGYVRFRSRFDDVADDTEFYDALEADFESKIREVGALRLLESLEDSLSNALTVSQREPVRVHSFTYALDRLFRELVEDEPVERFRTHVPLVSLRAAAGGLGPESTVEEADLVPLPAWRKPSNRLFAAAVEGDSMEPLIPDGSLNLFSFELTGSRQGKVVLIEMLGSGAGAGRYSVKRYTSTKTAGEDGWEHIDVTFVPHNHARLPWKPRPDEFRIVAEWLGVIE